MDKVIILGSGAAPGVPTISDGWGKCDAKNSKNRRSRAGIYVEIGQDKILIDTSADLRNQLIENNIRKIDAVFYTHAHADHLMGIDDLRALNYSVDELFGDEKNVKGKTLNIYATDEHITEIRHRFGYVLVDEKSPEVTHRPQLKPNVVEYEKEILVGKTEIVPLGFTGHPVPTTGYVFDEGKLVVVPDYKFMPKQTLEYLQNIDVNVLIMPLTNIKECIYHAGMDIDLDYIKKIKPKRVFFTHLGPECDYETVLKMCPKGIEPAYDNLLIEL